jgi:hypothetical protein
MIDYQLVECIALLTIFMIAYGGSLYWILSRKDVNG